MIAAIARTGVTPTARVHQRPPPAGRSEDLVDIGRGAPEIVDQVGVIAQQTPGFCVLTDRVIRRHPVHERGLRDLSELVRGSLIVHFARGRP